ncbi:MAG: FAD-dependent thymidylate synthase [Candidatus Dadabacteria bacterium]|nr:FAD-dependent thymidylate synthase [Candidatus Dadabacteria bacterium]
MPEEKSLVPDEIKKFVSNIDKDIYTVSNLPEEVIAVIFAYVSRSPKGFRENIGVVIKEEELGQERATKFHEKWVLNYGHASVAEHATVHLGIENVSRLFSSLLELSNEYLSFTEYSQRYQKPKRGDFYVPDELREKESLLNEYIELNNYLYDTYVQINDRLYEFLKAEIPTPEGTDEKTHLRALEKVAFEDARYCLSLATYTNLGVTGNARAIEDSLTKLLSSRYPEVRKRAEEIKREVRFSVPTLVKYAKENKHIQETRQGLEQISHSSSTSEPEDNTGGSVRLVDWTGKNAFNPEEVAIDQMIKAALFEHSSVEYDDIEKEIKQTNLENKLIVLRKLVEKLDKHDNPLNVFKLVGYEAEFVISEACWHQLLRHRKVNWITQEPSVSNGITVPPNVKESGAEKLLQEATRRSESLYAKLMNEDLPEVASYVVTNAHNRRIMGGFDLWELYHLINLRMSEGAQWDIKNIIRILAEEIKKYHPNLVSPALRRVNSSF